jgi:hypothetical protein
MALRRSGVILNLNVLFLCKTQYFHFRCYICLNRHCHNEQAKRSQYFHLLKDWRGRIHILNRSGGANLQDDYSVYIASPNLKVNYQRQYYWRSYN